VARKTILSSPLASATPGEISQLALTCSMAAEHVSMARAELFSGTADANRALAHLDSAIGCLKRLAAQGRALRANGRDAETRRAS
jgi:hypothetical protein